MSAYTDASLIMVPSGYKDGKLYSAKPTNGDGDFTFSRGSNLAATRVNSDGLIEKGRENLLLQSNQFDTTWANSSTTDTSGQSGYDGSNDAWLLAKTAASGYLYQNISQSGILTFSIYAKAGTLSWIRFVLNGSLNAYQYFDLSNGVLGSGADGKISASITDVGNGWYRCSLAVDNGTIARVRIYPADDDNDTSGTSGNIYIQDSQLELGLVATDYIETGASTAQAGILEDMPRLDYSGGATCGSLLLEPQRSNLITQSEYIDSFTKTRSTITQNALISPEGLTNAAKITQITSTAWGGIVSTYAPSSPATLSVFAKKIDNDFIAVIGHNSNDTKAYFDLANGTVGTIGTDATSASIEDFGNGWYRCIMTATTVNRYTILHATTDGGSTAPIGSETALWGCQLEQSASYPTSYIPTYGASVTRGADTSINYDNGNLPTAYPFTLYAEIDVIDTNSGNVFSFLDSSQSSFYYTIEYFSNAWHITSRPSGSTSRVSSTTAITSGTHKLLGIYTGTTMTLYLDGTLIASGSNTQSFNTNINDLLLGQLRVVSDTGNRNSIKEAIVFNTELSSDEAIQLTTI